MSPMDLPAKLNLISEQMYLEPTEEKSLLAQPSSVKLYSNAQSAGAMHASAPCGSSPAQMQKLHDSATASLSDLDRKRSSLGVYRAAMPGGKSIALLKTMLTTACERNCFYCPFRAGRSKMKRVTFKPEEMANAFMQMQQARFAEGLFLSSGIIGGSVSTQDKLLDTLEIVRRKRGFRGYIHLKMMPGAQREQIEIAMKYADRVSVNLEAPNSQRLSMLAPKKIFEQELLNTLLIAQQIRMAQPHKKWASTVTQFVVGAAGESDVELLSMTERLHKQAKLARAYFSAFHPISDTPLENHAAENPWREHRLYQSSFLLRDYGFELEELPFERNGNLPLSVDPKQAWAQQNLMDAPIEVNRADKRELLRIPGVGPKGADAILTERKRGALRELSDLAKIGVLANRAAPYVLLNGKRIAPPQQMRLL